MYCTYSRSTEEIQNAGVDITDYISHFLKGTYPIIRWTEKSGTYAKCLK